MRILGIETSCDETAAAVVEDGKKLLSNVVASSMSLHIQYGGVVPEIAARSHIESINEVIHKALYQAKYGQGFGLDGVQGDNEKRTNRTDGTESESHKQTTQQSAKSNSRVSGSAAKSAVVVEDLWDDIDGIAVTYGAGLGGSLLIGVLAARTLAILHNKPLYACNHVEGHVYANFITCTGSPLRLASHQSPAQVRQWAIGSQTYTLPSAEPQFPMLALIVSGGHTQLVLFKDHFDYKLLGRTGDDAIGEAFDKVAKVLGLPYPGGPSIAKAAQKGDPSKYPLPKAKLVDKYAFSFSGLKTAVLRLVQKQCGVGHDFPSYLLSERLSEAQVADIAASFQRVAIETVVDKACSAYEQFKPKTVVIAGGVAASQELRKQLSDRLQASIDSLEDLRSEEMRGATEEVQQLAEIANRVDRYADEQVSAARILRYPDMKLCTDNAAMIAALGCYKLLHNQPTADPYSLDIEPNLSM